MKRRLSILTPSFLTSALIERLKTKVKQYIKKRGAKSFAEGVEFWGI